jgi:hypothetical protein
MMQASQNAPKREVYNKVNFIFHGGRRILLFNFSNMNAIDESLELIRYSQQVVANQSPSSIFTLTDVTGSHYDKKITSALQDFAKHNKPYVIAGAVVGVSGLTKVIFRSVLAFSGRKNLQLFDDQKEALAWLSNYPTPQRSHQLSNSSRIAM